MAAGGAATWLAGVPLVGYVLIHVGLLWLVRSLYFYSGVLPALLDLGLSALGLAFAVWAAGRSGSPLLALWCFFLVQALHVCIPAAITGTTAARASDEEQRSTARTERRKPPCAGCPRRDDSQLAIHHSSHGAEVMKAKILVPGLVLATVATVVHLSHRCAATRRASRCSRARD